MEILEEKVKKKSNFQNLLVKQIMTKKPLSIDKNELAAKALSIMNSKKLPHLSFMIKKNLMLQMELSTFILFYNQISLK